ncbi:MAG TPA: amidohydrolase [Thermoanaerobaculia bacterium]|nr:amidohydrolase [Thermoanaerobaculia bacterium]
MPRCLAIFLLAVLGCATPPGRGVRVTTTDSGTLFIAGTVLAGPDQKPQKNYAIYVENGRVREVGPANALRAAHAGARVIDVSAATILPGLTDAHGHLYGLGLSLDTVDLVGASSYEEAVARVRKRAATEPAGQWILGRGWDQNRWAGKQFPTAELLDAAVADHPVWLRRVDGHAGLANSAAMRAAGIGAATRDPDGGRIIRDAAGNPTGVFVDGAMQLIDSKVPPPSFAQRKERVRAAAEAIAANGLTEMHDAGADEETIRAIRELIDEKRFPIRVYVMLSDDDLSDGQGAASHLTEWLRRGPLVGYGDRLTVRSIKLYADGALGSRGAALLAPYSDDPGNSGLVISGPEHILGVSKRALAAGFQVNTHAIGDRGVRNVIDAYERAGIDPSRRFRVEHLQVIAHSDVPRLSKLGIIASMQPTHATSDMPWAEARLGTERIKGAYAWRTVLDSGARIALGSDFPVELVNPFFGIYSAVTRQDQKGQPEGGWYPTQRLTLAEAIRGFTKDAAYAAFEEDSRGSIEPGKLADFTIVHENPYEIPSSQLWRMTVKYTVVGGEIVYGR